MYKVSDMFLLRTPLKGYNNFLTSLSTHESINVKNIIEDKLLKEGILISSYSLYDTLKNYTGGNTKTDNAIKKSITKYAVRQCTRATPFGLFAGVSLGKFMAEECIIDSTNQRKHIMPDYKWIMKIVKMIELQGGYKKLILFSNEALYCNGNRVINYNAPKYSQQKDEDTSTLEVKSIKNSPYIKAIIEHSKDGISYTDLVNILKQLNNKLDDASIEKFISSLLSEEYLYSNLRPTFNNYESIKELISKLYKYSIEFNDISRLEVIDRLFDEYNNTNFGDGICILEKIYTEMKYFSDDDKLINVNCTNKFKVKLPIKIKEEIEEVAKVLSIMSFTNKHNNQMKNQVDKFIEKYGVYREIPVLELLNEDIGIGFPSDYKNPLSKSSTILNMLNDEDSEKRDFLIIKITEALAKGEDVVLTDSDVKSFKKSSNSFEEYLDSMEINFLLSSSTKNNLENDDYTLTIAPNLGSPGAGRSFGRFGDVIDLSDIEKEIVSNESSLHDDILNAEILSAPIKGRYGNITFSNNYRDYFVNMLVSSDNSKKRLHISDILVGVEDDYFYLKSKSLNKRILVSANHMLNFQLGCNVYRFLREVCNYSQVREPFSFIKYDILNKFSYVPRIKYKNTILRVATWNLFKPSFKEFNNYGCFLEEMSIRKNDLNMPRFVYITEADNRTLIDLENNNSIKEIYEVLKKRNKCVLTEFEFDFKSNWLSIDQENFITEITIMAYKNKDDFKRKVNNSDINKTLILTKSDLSKKRSLIGSFDEDRNFNIFDKWVYLKLYCNEKRQDEILGLYIKPLIEKLKEGNFLEKHFFIRYYEDGSNIRLRLKFSKEDELINSLQEISKWSKFMKENRILSNITLDSYVREVERYGGPLTIDEAETFFNYQSEVIERFFYLKESKIISFDTETFVILNIINIMECSNISYEKQLALLETITKKDELRENFQKKRKYLIKVCNSNNDWQGLKESADGLKIYDLLKFQKESIQSYSRKIVQADEEKNLFNTKLNILLSSFHMLCNRTYGTDRDKEKETIATVRHCLYALKFYKKGGE